MKTLFAILIIASSFGCVKADLTVNQVQIHPDTTFTIPGCQTIADQACASQGQPAGCVPNPTAYCAAAGNQAVDLPPITQKINFKPPTGVDASVYVDEIDITVTNGTSLDFLTGVIVEISGPGIADEHFVDYQPSVAPTTELQLFPDDENVLPYIEGDTTVFGIHIDGSAPPSDVQVGVTIFLNGNVSFSKSL